MMRIPRLRQAAPRFMVLGLIVILCVSFLLLYLFILDDKHKLDANKMEVIERTTYTNAEMLYMILGYERGNVFQQNPDDVSLKEFKPRIFRYLLNNETICRAVEEPLFLLWVYSAPKHAGLRQALRRDTWARPSLIKESPSVTVFLLGTSEDPQVMAAIKQESRHYGDIVQVDYVETYHRLTYKGITALRWTSSFCRNAAFIVKADDDLLLDINHVIHVINNIKFKIQLGVVHKKVAVGMVSEGLEVPRNWNGSQEKLNVRKDILPNSEFLPTYLFGWTYILSNNLIQELYQASLKTPLFFIDDVFVTGMLTAQIPDMTMINVENIDPGNGSGADRFYLAHEAGNAANIVMLWCKNLPKQMISNNSVNCKDHLSIKERFKAGLVGLVAIWFKVFENE